MTQLYNVLNGTFAKAAREVLLSLNWPPEQAKEHKYECLRRRKRQKGEQTMSRCWCKCRHKSIINLHYVYILVQNVVITVANA